MPNGTFPIQNPTVGGGTAFNDIVAELLATLGSTQAQAAQVGVGLLGEQLGAGTEGAQIGAGIFNQLLGAETAARRRPVNIVDQLLLAGEFGSVMPLSQIEGGRLASLGGRTSPALGQLFRNLQQFTERRMEPGAGVGGPLADAIQGFAQQAIPQGRVVNIIRRPGQPDRAVVQLPNGQVEIVPVPMGGGLQTVQGMRGPFSISGPDIQNLIQRREQVMGQTLQGKTPQEQQQIIDYLTTIGERTAQGQEQLAERFRTGSPSDIQTLINFLGAPSEVQQRFQYGGSFVADPRRARTTGASATGMQAAGPISMVDRTGQTIGVAGEGKGPEQVNIEPLPVGLGGEAPGKQTGATPPPQALPRDVMFRLKELIATVPGLPYDKALTIAQNPGHFTEDPLVPMSGDPRAVAARLLAGGIQSDVRFQDPLVRALALGRSPTSAEMSGAEFAGLPPDLRDALVGIIGEEQLPGFLFALQAGTPTGQRGVRGRAAGGVRV